MTHEQLSQFTSELEAAGVSYEIASITQSIDVSTLLTERQHEFVVEAIEWGYYDLPRRCSVTDLAEAFGVNKRPPAASHVAPKDNLLRGSFRAVPTDDRGPLERTKKRRLRSLLVYAGAGRQITHEGVVMEERDHNHADEPRTEESHEAEGGEHAHGTHDRHALPGGLSVATGGLRLAPSEIRLEPNVEQPFTYQIREYDGTVVTEFEETHDELSHLIFVRRDLTRFQHRHPELGADGTWSQQLALPDPGVYRAFVDVRVDGRPTTLGVDLFAPGPVELDPRPDSTREATADGYDITLVPEDIRAGEDVALEFEFRRGGERVAQLHPYLGALGHLVALREGDLAYLHVHPEETDPEGGTVRFEARFPTAGRYRLFLQAKPEGDLLTTSFDVRIDDR
ncbi:MULTISPECIES: helix-turn-helix domain-containing protein [Natrialbaceae]|uniref:helix-turn-helix domain-containing protein n=1 Tax=Natrialbaceae TaxID=1644061 RepID=UPI00207D6029|nr:helix-turn-helix domain-containing protein [Natronococcus sp. CG52]